MPSVTITFFIGVAWPNQVHPVKVYPVRVGSPSVTVSFTVYELGFEALLVPPFNVYEIL